MEQEKFTITKINDIMRNFIHHLFAFSIVAIGIFLLTGCKGAGSRRAATKAIEFIEKKASSKAATAIEEEAEKAERTVIKESEERSTPSRSSRPHRPHHNSYDDEESYEPQVYTIQCPQCGGAGIVYMTDYYGNIQYDYFGNPMVGQCPYCNGTGVVIVTQ
jgi:hypothetical protein